MRLRVALLAGIAIVGVCLISGMRSGREQASHSVQGQSFTEWTRELQSGDSAIRDRAREVLQKNPRKFLEFYTTELQAEDSLPKRAMFGLAKFCGVQRKFDTAAERRHHAILGVRTLKPFIKLSPRAVQALSTLLLSTNTGLASLNTLLSVGSREEIPSEIVSAVTNGLRSPDPRVRRTALGALKRAPINDPAAIEALRRSLTDPSLTTQRTAAMGLLIVARDKKESVDALVALLKDADYGFQSYAISHLAGYGPKAEAAIPRLIETTRERDANLRQLAVYALGRIGARPQVVMPVLTGLSVDREEIVRRNVAYAIGSFGTDAADHIPVLRRLQQEDPSSEVRTAASFAIKEIELAPKMIGVSN